MCSTSSESYHLIFPARRRGEVGTEGEQFPQLFLRGFALAELAERRGPRGMGIEVIGHVDANRQLERVRVLALAIGFVNAAHRNKPGMIGIELHGCFRHLTTPLQLTGVAHEHAEDAHDRSIHGIEREGLFRRGPEGSGLLAEEVNEGQCVVAESMSRGEIARRAVPRRGRGREDRARD